MAFSTEQQHVIDLLRSLISHRVQMAAGSSFKLDARLGDDELWEDLRLGLNYFNTYPPIFTEYRFKDLYTASQAATNAGLDPAAPENETFESIFLTPVLMCAMFFTGLRLQWFEAGKHFRYNDNGITIERVKQVDYQNIVAGSILQYLTVILPLMRKSLALQKVHLKGQWSGMVSFPRSLTRGLRGVRTGF